MKRKRSRLVLDLEPEVQERLQEVSEEKGVSVQDLCRSAIDDALVRFAENTDQVSKPHFNIEALVALQKEAFGDRVLPTDSAEMIREAREERTRHLDSL